MINLYEVFKLFLHVYEILMVKGKMIFHLNTVSDISR